MFKIHIRVDQPAEYEIRIQGSINHDLSDWFQGQVSSRIEEKEKVVPSGLPQDGITVLKGTVADQPALHGLLSHIRDLGLTLLFVDCISAHSDLIEPADTQESNISH